MLQPTRPKTSQIASLAICPNILGREVGLEAAGVLRLFPWQLLAEVHSFGVIVGKRTMCFSSRHLVLFCDILCIIVRFCFHSHQSSQKKKRVNNENPISFSTFWKTSWKKELRLLVETLVQSHCGAVLQFIAVGIRQKKIDRVQFVSPSQEPISSDPTKC